MDHSSQYLYRSALSARKRETEIQIFYEMVISSQRQQKSFPYVREKGKIT
jgi:hypothetical protein